MMTRRVLSLLFAAALLVPAARAQFGAGEPFKAGAPLDIDEGTRAVFGRNAEPHEVEYWSKAQVKNFAEYVQALKNALKAPSGAKELKATIERSYQVTFGRLPHSQEFAYWQSEVRNRNLGYYEILDLHKGWLKSADAEKERKMMANRLYLDSYGRSAFTHEVNHWVDDIAANGTDYMQMKIRAVEWMLGSNPEQIKELRDTIIRAHSGAGKPKPNDQQIQKWMSQASAKKWNYKSLVAQIKKAS
jgi:hypothetical protein